MRRKRARTTSQSRWLLIAGAGGAAAVVIVLAVLAAGGVFGGGSGSTPAGDLSPAVADRLAGDAHVLGAAAAPVTVLEFADFQCPYCRAFWAAPLQQLKRDFIDTGVARLAFRHAIVVGPESVLAAEAAECAADQGEFFAYHDVLYDAQGPENAGYLTQARLSGFASRVGLDVTTFDQCLAGHRHRDQVNRASNEASDAGVNSTPSVFVNGRRIANPFDYAALRAAVVAASGRGG
jgi:protein-disulfide isomerase